MEPSPRDVLMGARGVEGLSKPPFQRFRMFALRNREVGTAAFMQ